MANKNIFNSLLSTVTTIGSLFIMGSCGYDACKTAKKSADAEVYNLNMQSQFTSTMNAGALINNPYQQNGYLNISSPTKLQYVGAKAKGWLAGAVKSLSDNFIPLTTAALGTIFNRNYFGKLFFIGSIASLFGKDLFKKNKIQAAQLNPNIFNSQLSYTQNTGITPNIVPNTPLMNPYVAPQVPQMYGTSYINPASPYIPNNSPYIPYQQQQLRIF